MSANCYIIRAHFRFGLLDDPSVGLKKVRLAL